MSRKASWGFAEGDEIVPGRRAVRSLGGGPVFEAYLARDERRLCLVVCKLIRPDQVGDARAMRLLRREAETLARLSHPAIVRSLDASLEGPRPHIALEHLNKLTLRARIRRRGPLPLARAVPLALQLASALHYLSSERIVHLDVKPGNVVLGTPPRLIDLSIAHTLDRARAIRRPVGTARYMSPEQCTPGERGEIGPAADVWGLGVTLYEAIAGRLPYPRGTESGDATPAQRYPQIVQEALPLPQPVPEVLGECLAGCLSRDPAARPTAALLVATLEPLAASLAQAAAPSGAQERAQQR
jgi:serine/threonine protein kinase